MREIHNHILSSISFFFLSISTLCSTLNTHEHLYIYLYTSIFFIYFDAYSRQFNLPVIDQTTDRAKTFPFYNLRKSFSSPNGTAATFLHQSGRFNKTAGSIQDVSRREYISPSHLDKNRNRQREKFALEQQPLRSQHAS